MDLRFSPQELAFREEVRSFINSKLPADIRARLRLGYPPRKQDTVTWQRILYARGWAAPNWPQAYGGPGWTPVQQTIFQEECFLAPAPPLLAFNITMVGPVIIHFGSEEQKRRFLPPIANLDIWFCQGFSEPGAGSDLASLRTSAKREGENYVVNGQKIWTTTAHLADWAFCLVRTEAAAKKQQGISFLLVDMKTPGITVRPIITLDGMHHTNEVFFDEVRVPVANLVGEENKGWNYAKFLLGNERTGIAGVGRSKERLGYAKELAAKVNFNGRPLSQDRSFCERVALLEAELKALEITQLRVVAAQGRVASGKPDPFSSILKIKGSEMYQAVNDLLCSVAGPAGMAVQPQEAAAQTGPDIGPDWALPLAPAYFYSRAASIYGGTNEIQKNILSKTVLGL